MVKIVLFIILCLLTSCGDGIQVLLGLDKSGGGISTSPAIATPTAPEDCSGKISNAPFAGGSGSVSDPYTICTEAQLNNISNSYLSSNFKLMANLDFSGKSFNMIGQVNPAFSAVFDGNNYEVSNISIVASSDSYVGFFRYLESTAQIKNLRITDISITGTSAYTGAIAGVNKGTIDYCFVSGSITGNSWIGGLVGANDATGVLNNSTVSGNITSDIDCGGGVTGGNIGTVINTSFLNGTILGQGTYDNYTGCSWIN